GLGYGYPWYYGGYYPGYSDSWYYGDYGPAIYSSAGYAAYPAGLDTGASAYGYPSVPTVPSVPAVPDVSAAPLDNAIYMRVLATPSLGSARHGSRKLISEWHALSLRRAWSRSRARPSKTQGVPPNSTAR